MKQFLILGQLKSMDIINLAISQGYGIQQIQNILLLKAALRESGQIVLYINAAECNIKVIRHYKRFQKFHNNIQFIFHCDQYENLPLLLVEPDIWIVRNEDSSRFLKLFLGLISGSKEHQRVFHRKNIQSSVIISSDKKGVLRGSFTDFSDQGAKIYIKKSDLKDKEYLTVSYLDFNQKWVKMISQVRWQNTNDRGEQQIGLKFLAFA